MKSNSKGKEIMPQRSLIH